MQMLTGWMDDLLFYILFDSISVFSKLNNTKYHFADSEHLLLDGRGQAVQVI